MEAEEARARAERAEESLELARATRAEEIKAAEDRAEEEAGRARAAEDRARVAEDWAEVEARRSRAALSQMMETENAIAARNLHIAELESVLQEAEARAREAEERANKAKEELSHVLSSLAAERESRAAEVEAAVGARTTQCIENYKASEQFMDEMAEASAEAFLQGFQHGKEKVARDLNFPQALEVEMECLPEVAPSDEEPAPDEP